MPHFELSLSQTSRLHVLAFHVIGPLLKSDKTVRFAFIPPTAHASDAARKYWGDHPNHVKDSLFLTWENAGSLSLDGASIIGDVNLAGISSAAARERSSGNMSRLKSNDKVALILLDRRTSAPAEALAAEVRPPPARAKGCVPLVLVLLSASVIALCVKIVI